MKEHELREIDLRQDEQRIDLDETRVEVYEQLYELLQYRVQLRLLGACGSCPVSMLTLKQGIERRIMMAVPEVRGILAL